MEFRAWAIEEGIFDWGRKLRYIPMFAVGAGVGLGSLNLHSQKPAETPVAFQNKIIVTPQEFGIPDSLDKGFSFFIKNYGHVSETDINIVKVRSGKGFIANASLQAILQGSNPKKQIAEMLNAQTHFGYASLPEGTDVDMSKMQKLPAAIIKVNLEDWPVITGSPFDPVYITGSVTLDLRKGEAWIAPSKRVP